MDSNRYGVAQLLTECLHSSLDMLANVMQKFKVSNEEIYEQVWCNVVSLLLSLFPKEAALTTILGGIAISHVSIISSAHVLNNRILHASQPLRQQQIKLLTLNGKQYVKANKVKGFKTDHWKGSMNVKGNRTTHHKWVRSQLDD